MESKLRRDLVYLVYVEVTSSSFCDVKLFDPFDSIACDMDDWELLFLQAAGKSSVSKSKRTSQEVSQPDTLVELKATAEVSHNFKVQKKRLKLVQSHGRSAMCLSQAGFRISKAADIKCKGTFAAYCQMTDLWMEQKRVVTPTQSIIRAIFLIVRNSRAIGFASSKQSVNPVLHAYRRRRKRVYDWLVEMKALAATCPEIALTKQYIHDSIECICTIHQHERDRDNEESSKSIPLTKRADEQHLKMLHCSKNHTRNCAATCLRLISCLDAIYGELLVAALYSGACLPDPRLYLESLSGQIENCEKDNTTTKTIYDSSSSSGSGANKICYSNPLQRYLELRAIEASALNIPALTKAAVEMEGLSSGPDEETMRGMDPLSSPTVRAWWHACRFRVAAWAAFACPNTHAIEALKMFSKEEGIMEVGAGVGYWAFVLRNAGINVLAYDKQPPSDSSWKCKKIHSNEYHGQFPAWSEVLPGDTAAPCKTDRVLLICYPPPDSAMGVKALQGFSGNRLAYVGEMRGDTGTADFEGRLRADWDLVGVPISLPNFCNTCYSLTLWQKRLKMKNDVDSTRLPSSWPFNCSACSAYPYPRNTQTPPSHFYRDRLTRAVWACSAECAGSDKAREALTFEVALRHIGYGNLEESEEEETEKTKNLLWKRITL